MEDGVSRRGFLHLSTCAAAAPIVGRQREQAHTTSDGLQQITRHVLFTAATGGGEGESSKVKEVLQRAGNCGSLEQPLRVAGQKSDVTRAAYILSLQRGAPFYTATSLANRRGTTIRCDAISKTITAVEYESEQGAKDDLGYGVEGIEGWCNT